MTERREAGNKVHQLIQVCVVGEEIICFTVGETETFPGVEILVSVRCNSSPVWFSANSIKCVPLGPGGQASLELFTPGRACLLVAGLGGARVGGGSWTSRTRRGLPAGADGWCNRFLRLISTTQPRWIASVCDCYSSGDLGQEAGARESAGFQKGARIPGGRPCASPQRRKAARPWAAT